MTFSVPKISQHGLVSDPKWDFLVCGIASLYMVLKYLDSDFSLRGDDVFEKCFTMNGYIPNIGWKHKELAQTAESLGFAGESYDWYSSSSEDAFEKLLFKLKTGPVIASIYNGFVPGNGGHLIVVTGIEGGAVYVNDPAEFDSEKIAKKIPIDSFLHGWKRRIIMIREKRFDVV